MKRVPSAAGIPHPQSRPVLVVDFGAQYAQLIARRVREAGLFSEVIPHTATAEEFATKDPRAIVLSGGPSSVNEEGAPALSAGVLDLDVPVFGICYGFQTLARAFGGTVSKTGKREYGSTVATVAADGGALLDGVSGEQKVWMSHADSVTEAPEGFSVLASTASTPIAAFEDRARKCAGVQVAPGGPPLGERPEGARELPLRGGGPGGGLDGPVDHRGPGRTADPRAGGRQKELICGLSGGVDSAVAAALVHKAVGDQLTCVFVDHGLLRQGEREQVERDFVTAIGVKLITVDDSAVFLDALIGVDRSGREA